MVNYKVISFKFPINSGPAALVTHAAECVLVAHHKFRERVVSCGGLCNRIVRHIKSGGE
jgi:hypothetical protein